MKNKITIKLIIFVIISVCISEFLIIPFVFEDNVHPILRIMMDLGFALIAYGGYASARGSKEE